ncbi:MAG: FecR domain-containing protein [Lunatimonas sp.]|uniref:FecR family protein n=1 Tax=Lunatimonas sp. TaxID=2060141 RepID=UPI00263ABC06|nr:FecR family protein [Lunatimonas sp.]MCC5938971.1 FecR domain-containing protein [Lunatimonas sp.]
MKSKEDFLSDPEFVRWVKRPTPELEAYWSNWIAANPDAIKSIKLAKEILMAVNYQEPKIPEGKRQEILASILKEAPTVNRKEDDTIAVVKGGNGWLRFARAAAILLFGVGLAWLVLDIQPASEKITVEAGNGLLVRSTNAGERLQLTLEDGTRIWLNSSTTLRYPANFEAAQRDVHLEGEAFFEVKGDSLRPFKVYAGDMVTTVLGTSFNVTTKDSIWAQVALVEGKLSVMNHQFEGTVLLKAGEMVKYDESTGTKEEGRFDIRAVTAWRNGLIFFQKAGMDEVLARLADWYGVEFQVIGQRKQSWSVTAEYENQTLENVLKSLSYVHKFTFDIDRKKVTINL